MKGNDLIKGIGYIDDDLAAEALEENKVRPLFFNRPAVRRWVAAAACVAVVVMAGVGLSQGRLGKSGMQDAAAPEEKDVSYTVGAVNEADMETVAEAEPSYAGVKEAAEAIPAEMPETEPADMPAGTVDSSREEEDGALEAVPQMIANYAGNYETACYVAPAGGEVGYSLPLQDAMAEYHDAVTYRVYADIFRSGEETPMAGNDPEVAELLGKLTRDYGIETALEPYTGADGKKQVLPVLYATFDQLRRFPELEGYGCMLFLYDEKTE